MFAFFRWLFIFKTFSLLLPYLLAISLFGGCFYLAFITRVDNLPATVKEEVMVIGKVMEIFELANSYGSSGYILKDPTGAVVVLSDKGHPQQDSILFVSVKINRLPSGKITLMEKRRFGAF